MVKIGPVMPICDVAAGPMRSIAIMTASTGTAVHSTAFKSDKHTTWLAMDATSLIGCVTRKCPMLSAHATLVASPASRIDRRRLTTSPLNK